MNLYLNILKELLKKDSYKYYQYVSVDVYIKENLPEIYKLFKTLELLQSRELKDYSIDDLEITFYKEYPLAKPELFSPFFKALRETEAATATVQEYLLTAHRRQKAIDLARTCIDFGEGRVSDLDFKNAIEEQAIPAAFTEEVAKSDFVTDDLQELFNLSQKGHGLKWRLDQMNQSLGPLRIGNFGFVFARPESGKTTFLASETTHFATQLEDGKKALWFNNEQAGVDVMTRLYQAALGYPLDKLYSDIPNNIEKFKALTFDRIRLVDDAGLTRTKVEELCQRYNAGLIIIDQIDKIRGFSGERYDLLLKSIYQWARELSKVYGPTIGVCQAGSTGEGKKWLTMDDVDSSHTAKQGEADWILGIGKTHEQESEYVRYFHLCKNKLSGGTIPELRHGRFTTRILPEIARYED